jgi:hypothetical protein
VGLNYLYTGKTKTGEGIVDTASGGQRVDLMPSVEYAFTQKVTLSLSAEVPVWHDAHVKAYDTNFAVRLSLFIFLRPFTVTRKGALSPK